MYENYFRFSSNMAAKLAKKKIDFHKINNFLNFMFEMDEQHPTEHKNNAFLSVR